MRAAEPLLYSSLLPTELNSGHLKELLPLDDLDLVFLILYLQFEIGSKVCARRFDQHSASLLSKPVIGPFPSIMAQHLNESWIRTLLDMVKKMAIKNLNIYLPFWPQLISKFCTIYLHVDILIF